MHISSKQALTVIVWSVPLIYFVGIFFIYAVIQNYPSCIKALVM